MTKTNEIATIISKVLAKKSPMIICILARLTNITIYAFRNYYSIYQQHLKALQLKYC